MLHTRKQVLKKSGIKKTQQALLANLINIGPPLAVSLEMLKAKSPQVPRSKGSGLHNGEILALSPDQLLIDLPEGSETTAILKMSFQNKTLELFQKPLSIKGLIPVIFKDKLCYLSHIKGENSQAALKEIATYYRKNQHIAICAQDDIEDSQRFTGFSDFMLVPKSLPELDWEDLTTQSSFLGENFSLPFLITGMTGGVENGEMINRRLAYAATKLNIPMGVGSQRLALESPKYRGIFKLKHLFKEKLFLIGNLGISQLLASADPLSLAQRAVEMIEADALAIHVNIMQELVQVEGDFKFKGAYKVLEELAKKLSCPLVVKEVGSGLDQSTVLRLICVGVKGIDVGGRGGTSWPFIEGKRSALPLNQNLGSLFRDWGIPTAYSLAKSKKIIGSSDVSLIATGGIRSGLMAALALGLGANMVGIGLPLLKAALIDDEEPLNFLKEMAHQLKIVQLATGAGKISDLPLSVVRKKHFFDLSE